MKRVREEKKLTQTKVATETGFDSSHVSRIERGEKKIPAEFVVNFAYLVEADVRQALLLAGYKVHDNSFKELIDESAALEVVRLLSHIESDRERQTLLDDFAAMVRRHMREADAKKAGKTKDGKKVSNR